MTSSSGIGSSVSTVGSSLICEFPDRHKHLLRKHNIADFQSVVGLQLVDWMAQ